MPGTASEKNAVVAFVNRTIDEIIQQASLSPDTILEEYAERGVHRPEGTTLKSLEDVRQYVPPEEAKKLSRRYFNMYAAMAGSQGFITGLGGLITLPVSVPADAAAYVAWLARGASAAQLAHGRETITASGDGQLKLAMLAGAGVSHVTVNGVNVMVSQMAKRVMATPYAKAPFQAAVKALAAKLGVQLTHKSFAKAVPLIGGAVNGSVQAGMVKAAGTRIVAHYQDLAKSGAAW